MRHFRKAALMACAVAVGGVLILAGGLKLLRVGSLLIPLWSVLTAAEAVTQMALGIVAASEAALGLTLILSPHARRLWAFVLVVFAAFLFVNSLAIYRGESHCDCLGAVNLRPTIVALLDALALAISAIAYSLSVPHEFLNDEARHAFSKAIRCGGGVGAALAMLVAAVECAGLMPFLGGAVVSTHLACTETSRDADAIATQLTIASRSCTPIIVRGVQQSCALSMDHEFPQRLAPGASVRIPVRCAASNGAMPTLVPMAVVVGWGDRLRVERAWVPIRK